jgi:hypothetical protein
MKRSPLKRNRRRPPTTPLDTYENARMWRMYVIRGGCVMCRTFPVPDHLRIGRQPELRVLQAHHVVGKRHLKREGMADQLWDRDNGLCLCEYHHGRHERAVQRVPRSLLSERTVAFALAHGFEWVLEREYL